MDETKLTPRQRKILASLGKDAFSRKEISFKLGVLYPVSKATLIRDLNQLVKNGLVKIIGKGRQAKYALIQENPLLFFIDKKKYFAKDLSERQQVGFNFDIYKHLKNLFTPKETKKLKSSLKRLSQQEKKLDPTIFKREIERFTVEFSWKSSKIEGNTYTLLETEVLIKQMKEAVGHSKYEAIMILNHKKAIDYILKEKKRFKKISLPEVISLHKILTQDLEITPGIRNNPVAISGCSYSPLAEKREIKKALTNLVKAINSVVNPLEKALISALMLAYIQPFTDGNKRTGRTLMNAIFLAHDYYPVSYRDLKEVDYIQALILFYEQNNLFYFKKIFIEQFEFAVNNYFRL